MDLNYFTFRVNGEAQCVPYKPEWSNKRGASMLLYQNLLDCIGVSRENSNLDVSPDDYINNPPLLAYDCAADRCNLFHTYVFLKINYFMKICCCNSICMSKNYIFTKVFYEFSDISQQMAFLEWKHQ